MAYPNYGNPWMVNPTWTNANTGNVGNQNNMSMNQNQLVYGNQQQNDGSLMTVFVQGEAGANAYPVASGNTVLLMDFESGKFWLKSNVNGIPQRLRSFSFIEKTPENSETSTDNVSIVSRDEFNSLSKSVSDLTSNVNKLIAELGGAE